jgi:hypothetical protein
VKGVDSVKDSTDSMVDQMVFDGDSMAIWGFVDKFGDESVDWISLADVADSVVNAEVVGSGNEAARAGR